MTSIKRTALTLTVIAGLLTPMSGCALFTAQRVGTFAAKETGKHVIKGYREHQREREYSDQSTDGDRHEYQTAGERSED